MLRGAAAELPFRVTGSVGLSMVCLRWRSARCSGIARFPPDAQALDRADTESALDCDRAAIELQCREPLRQCCQAFLELDLRQRLAQAAMHATAEHEMASRWIAPPDVEAIWIGVERRIAHRR